MELVQSYIILQHWLTNKKWWNTAMHVYLQIYIAVFFITGRALRGSALFLFFQTKRPPAGKEQEKPERMWWLIIIGIDHGYYAIKTPHVCFPTGLTGYDYEPYTMQNVLQYNGKFYVCGTGRQTLVRSKTSNDNYYLLTMAAIAQEIRYRRGERKTDVVLAAGLPLASFGREKKASGNICFGKSRFCVSGTRMRAMRSGFRM